MRPLGAANVCVQRGGETLSVPQSTTSAPRQPRPGPPTRRKSGSPLPYPSAMQETDTGHRAHLLPENLIHSHGIAVSAFLMASGAAHSST